MRRISLFFCIYLDTTQILPLEIKLRELDVVEVSIISSKVQWPMRIWGWLWTAAAGKCHLYMPSVSWSQCLSMCMYVRVWRLGLCSVLMLRFWFISSYGSGLVTLTRHQVEIKPHGLQNFCLVVQQIFSSTQWPLFGAVGPWLQSWLLRWLLIFSSQPSSPQTLTPSETGEEQEKETFQSACLLDVWSPAHLSKLGSPFEPPLLFFLTLGVVYTSCHHCFQFKFIFSWQTALGIHSLRLGPFSNFS